ncbi:MAG TPA: PDZ domain-containing protein, partial [Chloroflexota bacterium]|nr:PDZ domain-containing protein [Chloroflexota bacterium]
MTAEQGLAVLIEAWARLIEFHVEQPDPNGLLRAGWDGFSAALPAGQAKPTYPALAGTDPQADLRQFRSAYLAAAAPAAGGVEGQENLAYAGVQRMCQSLGDCNTSFVDSHQLSEQAAKAGPNEPIGGVGIRIKRWGSDPIVVWELLEGGAAGKAGIKAGDAILSVDGQDATKMTLDQLASSIRGRVGTSVKLAVEHPNGKKQEYSIKRSS